MNDPMQSIEHRVSTAQVIADEVLRDEPVQHRRPILHSEDIGHFEP